MLEIVPLPAFQDNYIWTLRDGTHAAVVDPGEARPGAGRTSRAKAWRWSRSSPRTTIPTMSAASPNSSRTQQGAGVRAEGRTDPGAHASGRPGRHASRFPRSTRSFSVLDIPGHTRAHVAYYGLGSLFCGDTLFACGCGRVFEGTPAQMLASLSKLAALPDETRVYCGHEYTLANIRFARAVDPGNAALAAREERAQRLRDAGRPTLPSTLGEERATNPFLRCAEPAVVESANKYLGARIADPVRVFAAIREWKNSGC